MKKLIVAAQEYERQRISRELHDELGHFVSTIRFGIESMLSTLPANTKDAGHLSHLSSIVEKLDRKVDFFTQLLRSPVEDERLKDLLSSFARHWEKQSGVPVKISFSGQDGEFLDYDIKNAVYRVMQEALTNILKHAGAVQVGVLLHIDINNIILVVEDDGCGFDSEIIRLDKKYAERHLGLIGMRERVETVGGSLTIESIPGVGTVIGVIIPLPPN